MTSLRVGLNYTPGGRWKSFMSLAPLVGTLHEGWVITRHTLLVMNKAWLHVHSGNFCHIPFSGAASVIPRRPHRRSSPRQPGCSPGPSSAVWASSSPITPSSMKMGELLGESPTVTSQGKARTSITARSRSW